MPTILLLGAFDTKAPEYAYLINQIKSQNCSTLTMNFGVMGTTTLFPVHIEADQVAHAAGADLATLRQNKDRGAAMKAMSTGAATLVKQLFDQKRFDAIIGMGGTGGSSVITSAMRALPVGLPKLCISTAAASPNVSTYVGISDILMMPSIVDVAGVNRISRIIMTRAAGAICGMARATPKPDPSEKKVIAATMFGNTTACVDACRAALEQHGYEVLVFHATGAGGRTMEALVDQGVIDAVLDITTTEWADEIAGGVFSAGPDRLSAPGRRGIPHLVAPGCIDMVNFGPLNTVPEHYRKAKRKLYEWNPSVTLMRTNLEENKLMAERFAEKLNAAKGPVAVLLPTRGLSILDGHDQPFRDRDADHAFFVTLRSRLRPDIPVIDVDANINDPAFSSKAVEVMLQLIAQHR
jgi:uncharacterized protein (UPF0261 family)